MTTATKSTVGHKATFNRSSLANHLKVAAMATPPRTTRDVLNYALVMVSSDESHYSVRATDGEVAVEMDGTCSFDPSEKGGWAFLVPPSTLHTMLSSMSDESIVISQDKDGLLIKGGGNELALHAQDASKFPGNPVAQFKTSHTVNTQAFLEAIKLARASTGVGDPQRYVTTGCLLVLDAKEGTLVGTDCTSMAVCRFDVVGPAFDDKAESTIVPKRSLDLLVKIISSIEGNMTIEVAPRAVRFSCDEAGVSLTTAIHNSKFPPWRQFEKASLDDAEITPFVRNDLLNALRRVTAIQDTEYQPIAMEFAADGVTLTAESDAVGRSVSKVLSIGAVRGTTRLNVSYVIPSLALVPGLEVLVGKSKKNGFMSFVGGRFGFFLSPLGETKR